MAAPNCITSTPFQSTRSPNGGWRNTSARGWRRFPRSRKTWKGKIMAESKFVYVSYIRTTPEKLWDALTKPEFTRLYWFSAHPESDWKPGSPWKLIFSDGRVADMGEIVESTPPRRLVIKWRHEIT